MRAHPRPSTRHCTRAPRLCRSCPANMSHGGCASEHPGQSMHKLAPPAGKISTRVCLGGQHRPATSINNT
eukprot:9483606-Alexandrium_andersonii.AAC.1